MKLNNGDFSLSEHLSFYEMTKTSYSHMLLSNREYGTLPQQQSNLKRLCAMLEKVRSGRGDKQVIIHSALRCPELNKSVGGTEDSQHLLGEAADFHIKGDFIDDSFNWILKYARFEFGQCILEKKFGQWGETSWIHLSLGDKCECLKFVDGKYIKVERGTV